MKDLESARKLAQAMVDIGTNAGVKTSALLTQMDEPLGYSVGNALEVREAMDTLSGGGDTRFRELCLQLAQHGLNVAGIDAQAEQLLNSRAALALFKEIVAAQAGGIKALDELPSAPNRYNVASESEGFVQSIDAEAIGWAAVHLGAGRSRKEDTIDPGVGFRLHKKTGDQVTRGDSLLEIHCTDSSGLADIIHTLQHAYTIGLGKPVLPPVVYESV